MTASLRDLPDRELVVRCARQDDPAAFGELVARHQERIYAAVRRFCGHEDDACDIVQRAFLNAFRKIREFKGDAAFSTWLYRIAFNEAISYRRERRRPAVSLEVSDNGVRSALEPVERTGPEARLESEETQKKVQQALDLLSDEDRQVILLRDLQGHSYEEIAEILGIPKGTVRSRLHRARLELRDRLKSFIGTLA
jgi:RNA polymerase sigma-70 factor (ECF subfamily)